MSSAAVPYHHGNLRNALIIAAAELIERDGTLDFSISDYISSEAFLFEVVNKQYDINGKNITLKEHWGSDYNDFFLWNPLSIASRINRYFMFSRHLSIDEKKESFAATLLYYSMEYSENRRTKMHHISLEIQDSPDLAKQIMNNIYLSILSYSKNIVNEKGSEKKIFVSNRLNEVKNDLERYENELLNFMIQNKDIKFSPTLSLQQQRLQKNISLNEKLFFTLSEQLELAKINEKDSTTSIFLLDNPSVNPIKSGLSIAKGTVYFLFLTYLVGYLYYFFHFRNELFINDYAEGSKES